MKRLLATFAVAFAIAPAPAAEVTVLSGGAVKSAFTAATAAWTTQGHPAVRATFAPAGEIRQRLAAGETYDVIVVPAENLAEFDRQGLLDLGTRRDLGGVAIGMAVKAGAAKPDISTPEALKRALGAATSLTYMDPARGTSGKHFDEVVLPKLGIRDAVRAKAVLGEGGFIAEKVARGEVQMAFHQMTEMLPVKGIEIVGPLPAELQKTTIYAAVVMKSAKSREEAVKLLAYLASGEGRRAFLERGFSAP